MNVIEQIGRLHPLFVHLPIGFLLMGLIIFWIGRIRKRDQTEILAFIFLLGSISAVLSCITGLSLSQSGNDNESLVTSHRNAAIFFSVIALSMWWLIRTRRQQRLQNLLSVLIFSLLIITGHQGGSLTHGTDYLFGTKEINYVIKPIGNIDEAVVYKDIINPIFQQKCVGCHGPDKQKGKLRLDEEQYILKGGKSGHTIVPGTRDEGELLSRIMLLPDDEDHMPPKEKDQLGSNQIALIGWWIEKGASFTAKVKDLKPDTSIKPALALLSHVQDTSMPEPELPVVNAAPNYIISRLQHVGVIVVPVSQHSNLLSVNFINCTSITDSVLHDLSSLSDQLYWVKAEGPLVNDSLVYALNQCKILRKLSLAHSNVTDSSLTVLKNLSNLKTLNVFNTQIANATPVR